MGATTSEPEAWAYSLGSLPGVAVRIYVDERNGFPGFLFLSGKEAINV